MKKFYLLFAFNLIALFTFGQAGNALDFDGSGDYVTIPNAAGENNFSSGLKFTVEFWCKVNTTGTTVFVNKGGGGGLEQYSFDVYGSTLRYYVQSAGGSFVVISATAIMPAEGWVHLAGTFDAAAGEMKLYKNGAQIGSTTPPASLKSNTNSLALGRQTSGGPSLNGELDEVRIWDIALSACQIASLYDKTFSNPTAPASCLKSYYRMSNGSGTSLTDDSGNGNTGTLQGNTSWVASGAGVNSQTAPTWTGCAGDGLWTTAANWDNGVVPAATDNVVIDIDQTVTVSGAAFAKSITMSNGGDLTVNASNTLIVSTAANPATADAVNIGSGCILTNNGTISISDATNDEINNSGTVTNTGGTLEIKGNMLGISSLAGTLAPGNSVGQTDNNGSLTLTGTLQIEADDQTTFDVLNSTTNAGTLDLTAATLDFVFAGIATDYTNGDKFQIITNFGTVTAVGTITNNLGFTIVNNGNGEFEILSGALLPVELIYFSAQAENETVQLAWQTASEINNEGFEVQHSATGSDWKMIDFVAGKGNSVEVNDYRFVHTTPNPGINYYRLKQVDFDGVFEYSNIVIVNYQSSIVNYPLNIYPNPVRYSLTIENGQGTAIIYNALGQLIEQIDINASKAQLDVSELPQGIYTIHIRRTNGENISKQFVK